MNESIIDYVLNTSKSMLQLKTLTDKEFIEAPRPVRAIYICERLGEYVPTSDYFSVTREYSDYFYTPEVDKNNYERDPEYIRRCQEVYEQLEKKKPEDRGPEWWIHNPEDFLKYAEALESVEEEYEEMCQLIAQEFNEKKEVENVETEL